MARSTTIARPRAGNCGIWTGWLCTRDADIARQQSLRSARFPPWCIFMLALSSSCPPRIASRPRHGMTPPNLLHGRQCFRQLLFHRPRSARLSDGQRPRKTWERGHGNAGEHQARQDGDRQDILLYSLTRRGVRSAEDYALDFVVYSPAGLECIRSGLEGEVV